MLHLQPCTLHQVKGVEEVKGMPDNAHCRPESDKFGSIAFLRQPDDIVPVW